MDKRTLNGINRKNDPHTLKFEAYMRWSKYKNKKIDTPDGRFDSKKELNRWMELKLLESAGRITDLKRQVKYELIPSQKIKGKVVERAVNYIADFYYREDGREVVEDAKGFKTPEYIIKRKLMLYIRGIRVKEI